MSGLGCCRCPPEAGQGAGVSSAFASAPRGFWEGIARSRRDRREEEAVLPPVGCGCLGTGTKMSTRGPQARLPRAKPRPRGWQSRGMRRTRVSERERVGDRAEGTLPWGGGSRLAPGPWPLVPVPTPGVFVALDVFEGPACSCNKLPFTLSWRERVSAPPSRSRRPGRLGRPSCHSPLEHVRRAGT